jgi:hypothetical protein
MSHLNLRFLIFILRNAMIETTCERMLKMKEESKNVKHSRCDDRGKNQGLKIAYIVLNRKCQLSSNSQVATLCSEIT